MPRVCKSSSQSSELALEKEKLNTEVDYGLSNVLSCRCPMAADQPLPKKKGLKPETLGFFINPEYNSLLARNVINNMY